jgi:hypothetical protein
MNVITKLPIRKSLQESNWGELLGKIDVSSMPEEFQSKKVYAAGSQRILSNATTIAPFPLGRRTPNMSENIASWVV